MYERSETDISRKHLEEVVRSIEEPIVVLGGWAVYLLVNEKYRENTGRDYIGSMDIDLGFRLEGGDLGKTTFARVMRKLEDDLGFRLQGFRLHKQMRLDTGELLTDEQARRLDQFDIFHMYVDLVVDEISPDFANTFGFTPVDEPLLKKVFTDPTNRIERKEFGRTVWLPKPEVLLAMKVKSLPGRQLDYKKLKDVADAAALVLFGGAKPGTLLASALVAREDLAKFAKAITPKDITEAARLIGIDATVVEAAIKPRQGNEGGLPELWWV